jgi:PiT family inorganic phosphate transporter
VTLLVVTIVVALAFDFTNGFHDTANAVATSISTRALSPRLAVLIAALANLGGAFVTTAVATTIGKGIIDTGLANPRTVLAAVAGAIVWNLLTWWLGLPSSSSHALIGGLIGAALVQSARRACNGTGSRTRWSSQRSGRRRPPSSGHFSCCSRSTGSSSG